MTFSYFITAINEAASSARVDPARLARIAQSIRLTPGLLRAELYTPADIETYHRDGPAPLLAVRLEFDTIESLEMQITDGGYLRALAQSSDWADIPATCIEHQAMLTRTFLPLSIASQETPLCSYLVHYPGAASSMNDWLRYYLAHHPQIMRDYPEVRQIHVFTRIDWCDAMPWKRVDHMQRNMLSFPSPTSMLAALESTTRARMREDNGKFPPFSGGAIHFPMMTTLLQP